MWLWAVTALVLDLAGAQHVYALPTVAAAALALLALVWIVPPTVWHGRSPTRPNWEALLRFLPTIAFIAEMVNIATFVPKGSGWTPERLWLLASGIIVLLGLLRAAVGWTVLTAIVLGTIQRTIHMDSIPIVPTNGDMLPLVNGAVTNFVAGRSPYMTYKMPWAVPLTYLPITWLSYLPPYLLKVDLRWSNIVAELVILGALAWLSAQRNGWRATWRAEPTLILWAWLFLQPTVINWDTGNTAPITWALIAVTLALTLGDRPRAAAIALGLTAAGTPLVIVFGVFIGLFWLRRYGIVRTAQLSVISGIVAAIFVLPFLLWAPQDFITGTYRWFNNINGWPRQKWVETDPHIWSVITGFSGEFWARGTERWLKPIQALIVVTIAALYWLRGARRADLGTHAAVAYLGFMLFNPVLWPYLYNPALIAGLVGLVGVTAAEQIDISAVSPVAEARAQQATLT